MSVDRMVPLPDSSEVLAKGLVREWFHDRRVVLYKLTVATPEIIAVWAEAVQDCLRTWPRTSPYLAIHDLSQPGISLQYAALVNFDMMNIGVTLEGRMACDDLFDAEPLWSARVAVQFNLSLSGQTNRTLMGYLNRDHPSIKYKTFYHRGKALRWLMNLDATETGESQTVNSD
ncbi:hypothetical protein VZO05_16050 (plasmid) [Aggregatilineales bacterium SYSU G02658]